MLTTLTKRIFSTINTLNICPDALFITPHAFSLTAMPSFSAINAHKTIELPGVQLFPGGMNGRSMMGQREELIQFKKKFK